MFQTSHIQKINYICHKMIPYDTEIIPRIIKPNREEIEFLTGGSAYYEVDGSLREIGAGAILWHLGGEETVYKTDPKNPYRVLVVSFNTKQTIGRQVPRCSFWKERENPELFALDLLNTYNASGYDKKVFCHYVYARLIWNAHLATIKQDDPFLPGSLKKSMEFIEDNYKQDISIEDIARSSDQSVSYLHKLYKKYLNTSPHQVLLNRRLQESKSLLSTTDLLVKEIAFRCGFFNVINFGRVFKRDQGVTPSQYRDRHTASIRFGEKTNEEGMNLLCD